MLVVQKRFRGKLAAGLSTRCVEQKIMEIHAVKKICETKSAERCDGGNESGQRVAGDVAIQGRVGPVAGEQGHASAEQDGATCDQSWP